MEDNKEFIPKGFEKVEEQAPFTWRQLKEQVNNIDEQFLDEQVRWWGDERGGTVKSTFELEERYYNTDEGYAPESTFDEPLEEAVDDMEDFIEKGTPILSVD